jgi:hypothetical protein
MPITPEIHSFGYDLKSTRVMSVDSPNVPVDAAILPPTTIDSTPFTPLSLEQSDNISQNSPTRPTTPSGLAERFRQRFPDKFTPNEDTEVIVFDSTAADAPQSVTSYIDHTNNQPWHKKLLNPIITSTNRIKSFLSQKQNQLEAWHNHMEPKRRKLLHTGAFVGVTTAAVASVPALVWTADKFGYGDAAEYRAAMAELGTHPDTKYLSLFDEVTKTAFEETFRPVITGTKKPADLHDISTFIGKKKLSPAHGIMTPQPSWTLDYARLDALSTPSVPLTTTFRFPGEIPQEEQNEETLQMVTIEGNIRKLFDSPAITPAEAFEILIRNSETYVVKNKMIGNKNTSGLRAADRTPANHLIAILYNDKQQPTVEVQLDEEFNFRYHRTYNTS